QLPSRSTRALPTLTVSAKTESLSQDIEVEVAPPAGDGQPEGTFTVKVRLGGAEEVFENVAFGKKAAKNVTETINQTSKFVTVVEEQFTGSLAERVPEAKTYYIRAQAAQTQPLVKVDDFGGDIVERSGIEGFQIAEDVTMVCAPDVMAAYQSGALDKDGVKS